MVTICTRIRGVKRLFIGTRTGGSAPEGFAGGDHYIDILPFQLDGSSPSCRATAQNQRVAAVLW